MTNRVFKFKFYNHIVGRMSERAYTLEELQAEKVLWTNVIPLQFTGLQDKLGGEVYEGDVIESESHNPSKMRIEFIEGGFCAVGLTPEAKMIFPIDINHFYPSGGCTFRVVADYSTHTQQF